MALWLVLFVVNFFDEAAAHEAGGDERGSVIVHPFQQLLGIALCSSKPDHRISDSLRREAT